jgi:cytochrome c peroxidase
VIVMSSRNAIMLAGFALVAALACANTSAAGGWSPAQIAEIRSLWIGSLESLPADPSNRVADDPAAARLGETFFFDTRFSGNGKVACATCHVPDRQFQDGTALASGVGTTNRRTMPVAGSAYSPFLFWDGRKDSLWAQALGPLESPVEHGGTREQYARIVRDHYRTDYERLFGALPDLAPAAGHEAATAVFVNVGKAIAAYERTLRHAPSRFDEYAKALVESGRAPEGVLSGEEIAGLRLFIGKANCVQCHNGPLFTNQEFHNTGVPARRDLPRDRGRATGARDVLADEFNCRSRWSDASAAQCTELEFMIAEAHELERAFKVPSLRDVAGRAPYMHAGQLATLGDVLAHYNRAPAAPSGHTELKPLKLDGKELAALEAFLRSLSGGVARGRAD